MHAGHSAGAPGHASVNTPSPLSTRCC